MIKLRSNLFGWYDLYVSPKATQRMRNYFPPKNRFRGKDGSIFVEDLMPPLEGADQGRYRYILLITEMVLPSERENLKSYLLEHANAELKSILAAKGRDSVRDVIDKLRSVCADAEAVVANQRSIADAAKALGTTNSVEEPERDPHALLDAEPAPSESEAKKRTPRVCPDRESGNREFLSDAALRGFGSASGETWSQRTHEFIHRWASRFSEKYAVALMLASQIIVVVLLIFVLLTLCELRQSKSKLPDSVGIDSSFGSITPNDQPHHSDFSVPSPENPVEREGFPVAATNVPAAKDEQPKGCAVTVGQNAGTGETMVAASGAECEPSAALIVEPRPD